MVVWNYTLSEHKITKRNKESLGFQSEVCQLEYEWTFRRAETPDDLRAAYHHCAFVANYALRHIMMYGDIFFITMNQGVLNRLNKRHIIIGQTEFMREGIIVINSSAS